MTNDDFFLLFLEGRRGWSICLSRCALVLYVCGFVCETSQEKLGWGQRRAVSFSLLPLSIKRSKQEPRTSIPLGPSWISICVFKLAPRALVLCGLSGKQYRKGLEWKNRLFETGEEGGSLVMSSHIVLCCVLCFMLCCLICSFHPITRKKRIEAGVEQRQAPVSNLGSLFVYFALRGDYFHYILRFELLLLSLLLGLLALFLLLIPPLPPAFLLILTVRRRGRGAQWRSSSTSGLAPASSSWRRQRHAALPPIHHHRRPCPLSLPATVSPNDDPRRRRRGQGHIHAHPHHRCLPPPPLPDPHPHPSVDAGCGCGCGAVCGVPNPSAPSCASARRGPASTPPPPRGGCGRRRCV